MILWWKKDKEKTQDTPLSHDGKSDAPKQSESAKPAEEGVADVAPISTPNAADNSNAIGAQPASPYADEVETHVRDADDSLDAVMTEAQTQAATETAQSQPVALTAMAETGDAAALAAASASEPVLPNDRPGTFLDRLRNGLTRSTRQLTGGISDVFTKKKLDQDALDDLEDILITADLGVATAAKLTKALAKDRFDKDIDETEVRAALADEIASILTPVAKPLVVDTAKKPFVILVVGVNGAGKTTTIAKLAQHFKEQGKSVMLAAGDTFRAAAVEQLKVWGERIGVPVMSKDTGADAAALAYESYQTALAQGVDVLMIDTAGRLQNKSNLMDELEKIVRVMRKHDDTLPHETLLVLDATTGQNAHSQTELFAKAAPLTGLVITKLDGTAKGGVVVSLAESFALPIYAIGIGESKDDLRPFTARDFARSLMGLDA